MKNKNLSMSSIFFLLLGFLLLLSLFLCINIINSEKDLVSTNAEVTEIIPVDSFIKNKSAITVSYIVDNITYQYDFNVYREVSLGEKIPIYYHTDNVISVQRARTSNLIFLCPLSGLILVLLSIIDFVKGTKRELEEDPYKTKVISVNGNTEQLKIIPENEDVLIEKTVEEQEEVGVKEVHKKKKESIEEEYPFKEESKIESVEIPIGKKEEEVPIQTLKKVLPKYFYLSGDTLVCELIGDVTEEIPLNKIIRVVKTINSEGQLVKVTIYTSSVRCLLTHMYKVDLESITNQIHNKMLSFDEKFKEEIENKEY